MSDKKTRGLSIAKKMTIFGTVVFVVLLISTIIKYSITKTADHNFDIYTSKAVAGKIYVLEIGKDLNYISRCTRDIMLGNAYEKNIQKIQKSRNSIIQGFKKLKATMIGTPKEAQQLARLEDAKKKVLAFIDDGFNKMKSLNNVEQTPKTLALMYQAYKKDATPLANESREAFAKIIKYKNKGLEKRTQMYHTEMRNLERYMLIEFIVLLVLIVGYLALLTKSFTTSLDAFKHGLISFFNFVNGQSKEVNTIVIKSKDEFGMMANLINENIERTKNALVEEKELIDEASVVISRVQHGWYSQLITKTSENEGLNAFRNGINDMIKATKAHFNTINESLETYANYDYTKALVVKDIESGGVFELLVKDINKLRDAINTMLQDNKRTGLSLNGSAQVLLKNVNELNTNSNTAASSLEETAAALDEITSNVANSTEKIMQMSSLANEVTNSAKEGEQLATQTTFSMDEINTQVESINEAISVIDQIAFQTNILSLNAAVEAATAGEAGKGFAVVAGEVRNLASRSSEAAKEIKELVENATQKANEGKNISDKMISGYESLNDNIKKTIDLIADVSTSSKEQQQGIVQINDAINNLDSQTQANASIATQTNEVAKETSAMAQAIVSSADEKEFEGKNDIKL